MAGAAATRAQVPSVCFAAAVRRAASLPALVVLSVDPPASSGQLALVYQWDIYVWEAAAAATAAGGVALEAVPP